MKFTCEKALLQAAIATASRAVSPKSSIPALEGLLLSCETMLTVTGYNLETGIRAAVSVDIDKAGAIILPARLFGEIIRKMPDDVVSFEAHKLMVTLKCGMSEFTLMGMDPDDFPQLPVVDYRKSFQITEASLRAMIEQTIFAVSDNDSRPIHTGSLFEVGETKLTMVSVDGFRLAMRREEIEPCEGGYHFVTPGAALLEVARICKDTGDLATVLLGDKHIVFEIGEVILISRRLEGEFLAWEKAIPKENPVKIVSETKNLLSSIERVSLIITDKLKSPLRCVFGDQTMDITTKTAIGTASDCCYVEGDGAGLEIGFNNRYMLDALRAAPAEKVRLELSSGVSPCVIKPHEGEVDFIYMVLPVRLRAGE